MNKKGAALRKNTPDILANLMGSVEHANELESNKAIKPESSKAIQKKPLDARAIHKNNTAIKQYEKQENNTAISIDGKEKTTFNLSLKTLEALEDIWIVLRRKLKGEQRITKTLIVEKAIEMAIEDLESKSELSDLYARLRGV